MRKNVQIVPKIFAKIFSKYRKKSVDFRCCKKLDSWQKYKPCLMFTHDFIRFYQIIYLIIRILCKISQSFRWYNFYFNPMMINIGNGNSTIVS